MTAREFHEDALKAITSLLKKGDVTMSRLSEIAKAALDLTHRGARAVTQKSLDVFLKSFPECASFFKKKVEEAEAENRETVLTDIRAKIGRVNRS